MAALLFGVETEYAIAGATPRGTIVREEILQGLMERARERFIHLPDLHSPGGVFLENGSRFYIDCGLHPEICTPECANPWDAVRYIQAGHRILAGLAASSESAARPGSEIMVFRSNVDYSGTHSTWGCHESYMHRIAQDSLRPEIVPHLVTRLIYTGAGGFNPLSRGLEFTLSPRMAYFQREVTESSTSERGIWHEKSEPLCADYSRLHVLCGESLCSESATFLKIGVSALVVAMADAGLNPGRAVQLADPLAALQSVARDVTCRTLLKMNDGRSLTAIAIQRHYLEFAEAHLADDFMPPWAADVCGRWRAILDQLEGAPDSVGQTLDWGIKWGLFANHARSLGLRWDELILLNQVIDKVAAALDARTNSEKPVSLERAIGPRGPMLEEVTVLEPLLQSRGLGWKDLRTLLRCRKKFFEIDTRFGQLGPKGIFQSLDQAGVLNHRVSGVDNIEHAILEPPTDSRARIRGEVIRRLAGTGNVQCDWQWVINYSEGLVLDLTDPFASEESWVRREEASHGRSPRTLADLLGADGDFRTRREQTCYSRRLEALRLYRARDYSGAEALLRGLVEERYEVASNRCHLARVLILMDRDEEARLEVNLALDDLEGAYSYVLPRILFFQWTFAILDGADDTSVAQLMRDALRDPAASSEWTIQPMLDYLRPRLGESNFKFLEALAKALSYSVAAANLEGFSQWRGEPATHEVAQ